MKANLIPLMQSDKQTWGTPLVVFDALNSMYGPFDLDAAASYSNAKCKTFFDGNFNGDGLVEDWGGGGVYRSAGTPLSLPITVFLNPPYQDSEKACKVNCKKKRCIGRGHITEDIPGQVDWIKKAFEESQKGCTVVCLIPARTDTKLWHTYVMKAKEVLFVEGRITFEGAEAPAPFPSAVVVFAPGVHVTQFKSWSVPK